MLARTHLIVTFYVHCFSRLTEVRTKNTNALCGQNGVLMNIEAAGT